MKENHMSKKKAGKHAKKDRIASGIQLRHFRKIQNGAAVLLFLVL